MMMPKKGEKKRQRERGETTKPKKKTEEGGEKTDLSFRLNGAIVSPQVRS